MTSRAMLALAVNALNEGMKDVGQEVNSDKIAAIVLEHAAVTAVSAAASGTLPGAGGLIALGIASASTATMYGRLAKNMGVKLSNGLIKALASAVVADLVAAVATTLAVSTALSFIPAVGNMAAATLTGITNYGFIYLAGLIFIKMASALGVKRMETMNEDEMKAAARQIQNGMDIKKAMKEARASYKDAHLDEKKDSKLSA